MKIGVVTIVDYTNFGNRLQNYAVCHFLKKEFDCQAITLASYVQRPFNDGDYIGWLKEQIVKKACIFPSFAEKRFGTGVTRWANFKNWSKKIPTKNYYGCNQLPRSLNNEYDYFFVGSDQVWNYHFSSSRFDDFFLKFADDKKKCAISASFGFENVPEEWKKSYIDGLSSFSHLSVREDAGQTIVKELLGREAAVLIDPVMMLSKDEWLEVSKKPRVDCSEPYVLKYYLGDETEDNKIDMWALKNGYKVYELLDDKVPELYSAGPGEFISLISNAALVCSDSFHCIVFSIIFSKPFIVYERQGYNDYMTSRLTTLLKKFHFENRWNHELKENQYLDCDYKHVKELLKIEQKKFKDYVSNVLNENEE